MMLVRVNNMHIHKAYLNSIAIYTTRILYSYINYTYTVTIYLYTSQSMYTCIIVTYVYTARIYEHIHCITWCCANCNAAHIERACALSAANWLHPPS